MEIDLQFQGLTDSDIDDSVLPVPEGSSITSVNLSFNSLTKIPPLLHQYRNSLEKLVLGNNKLAGVSLGEQVYAFTRLLVLSVDNCSLAIDQTFINQCVNLISLDISSNRISKALDFSACSKLETLRMSDCDLDDHLLPVLPRGLTALDLSSNPVSSGMLSAVLDNLALVSFNADSLSLEQRSQITQNLQKHNERIAAEALGASAAPMVVDPAVKLLSLTYAYAKIEPDQMEKVINSMQFLEELNLSTAELTTGQCERLVDALPQGKHLRKLVLGGNKNLGRAASLSCLSSCPRLHVLDVQGIGMEMINFDLCVFLTELNLSMNVLGDPGAFALASRLSVHNRLKALNLYRCGVSDKGALALSDALRHNKSLESLCLEDNRITDVGANAFVDVLEFNMVLCNIELEDNDVTFELMEEIEELLERNERLLLDSTEGASAPRKTPRGFSAPTSPSIPPEIFTPKPDERDQRIASLERENGELKAQLTDQVERNQALEDVHKMLLSQSQAILLAYADLHKRCAAIGMDAKSIREIKEGL